MGGKTALSATPVGFGRSGSGEQVLLVHGFTMTWHCWSGVLDELSDEFDVLAPTLPFHWGGPPGDRPLTVAAAADHLESVLDEMVWPTAHIAGHSFGGWLALELGRRGRARSVTAVAPSGLWRRGSREAARLRRKFQFGAYTAGLSRGFANPVLAAVGRATVMRMLCHDPGRVDPELAAIALQAPAHCTARDIDAIWPGDTALDILDRIPVPVTVVFNERDRVLPPSRFGAQLIDPAPGLRIFTLPRAGHVSMLEAPAAIAAEIRRTARGTVDSR